MPNQEAKLTLPLWQRQGRLHRAVNKWNRVHKKAAGEMPAAWVIEKQRSGSRLRAMRL
jgi:hypothetical protein